MRRGHGGGDEMTIMLVFGSYGGFYVYVRRWMFRICLGWVAFTIADYDIENAIANQLEERNQLRKLVKPL